MSLLATKAELEQERRRTEQLVEDARMLDWAERNRCGVVLWFKDGPDGITQQDGFIADKEEYGIELARPTIREAWNAAMSREKGTQ